MNETHWHIINKDDERASIEGAVAVFSRKISEFLSLKPRLTIGCAAGRALEVFYLAARDTKIPWSQLDLFLLDERMVPLDHPTSNARMIATHLAQPLIDAGHLKAAQWHPFNTEHPSPPQALRDYNSTLAHHGGQFDIALLSIGEDGHLASLFPCHPSIEDESEGYITVAEAPKPPPLRISASRHLVQESRSALVFFLGESKRDAFARFRDPVLTVTQCPAKILYRMRDVVLITSFMRQVTTEP